MTAPLHHPHETASNADRDDVARLEPQSLRTFTPTQAVLAKSAGVFHWTPEGRRLYDFTSGVLVANLGHNPDRVDAALRRVHGLAGRRAGNGNGAGGYFAALPLTAYNAVTPVETEASRRLVELLQARPGGKRLEQVMWAASGSEAIQKALWAALARDRTRDDDPRHALRLPRQEGPRRRRHRLRDRPRARPARPLHQLPDGRVRRRQPARPAVRPGALPQGAGRPARSSSAGSSAC